MSRSCLRMTYIITLMNFAYPVALKTTVLDNIKKNIGVAYLEVHVCN